MRSKLSDSVKVFYPACSREDLVRALRRGAAALEKALPLHRVVLFGSHAAGRNTIASNVDVLVIYRGDPRTDAFGLAKKLLGVPRVEPHVYSDTEAAGMHETIQRMVRNGVRIYPTEAATCK